MSQLQLLSLSRVESDVVYTPDWVAKDMVSYFQPCGKVLEPAAGGGVFLKYLPAETEWCEIEKGVDFYARSAPADWIIGNPPYSDYSIWLAHSMIIAPNIAYLIPINKAYNSYSMMKDTAKWGGIAGIRVYGPGSALNFPIGFAIGAVYYRRGWRGPTTTTFYEGEKNV